MKKSVLLITIFSLSLSVLHAQGLKGLLKKGSTGKSGLDKAIGSVTGKSGSGLSTDEIVAGLKQALEVGATKGTEKLSLADGFFKDAFVKILMPEEAKKVEKTLRSVGMGKQVDNAILSMNRAAEDASKSAAPIFINAIKQMTATNYLKEKTTIALTEAFRPIIEKSLEKVDATKYWNTVFTTYNKFSSEKVNTDLVAYVTERGLAGIFYKVGEEEKKIRKDPLARTTDILKKVFAN